MNKRVLSLLLSLCMLVSLLVIAPVSVSAENSCGDNLTWSYSNGTLTISGTGDMTDFETYTEAPWYPYRDEMTAVHIGEGVTSIGDYAFYAYMKVTDFQIPDSVTAIGNFSFWACDGLVDLVIPKGVKTIGVCAFKYSYGLKSVVFGTSVAVIGEEAFSRCTALESVSFGVSLTRIDYGAFAECTALKEATYAGNLGRWNWILEGGNDILNEIVVCASLDNTYVAGTFGSSYSWMIDGNKRLYFAPAGTYTGSLTYWGEYIDSISSIYVEEGVTRIPAGCFSDFLLNQVGVHLPDSLLEIGSYAFFNSVLWDITLPKNLVSIEDSAFESASLEYDIIIPDSVTTIGNRAFAYNAIEEVTFGNSITTIGNEAFTCVKNQSLVFPESLQSIGDYAFEGCNSLESITFLGNTCSIGEAAFQHCKKLTDVTLPDGLTALPD
ncbi:MAG: leucine-rich repeat domain-containing protein, partial [Clostridia bacterium]|nr:leucine-rich repeat domain-containing protein [Clostridia bacterium]